MMLSLLRNSHPLLPVMGTMCNKIIYIFFSVHASVFFLLIFFFFFTFLNRAYLKAFLCLLLLICFNVNELFLSSLLFL